MPSIYKATVIRNFALVIALCSWAACSAQKDARPETTSATKETAAEGSVALKFAWPDGLRAKVRTTAVKSQAIGPQSRIQDMVSTYTMNVRHAAEEISVAFEDFQVDPPPSGNSNPAVEKVLAFRPGFTVDKKGALSKVIGLETLRDLLRPLQDYIASTSEKERAGLQAVARTVASEPYLKARVGADWGNLIGNWLDQTLTPGQTKTTTVESQATGFVDEPLKTEVKVSMAPISPCHRGTDRACVRLWMTRQPDQEALREAMRPNLGKILGVEDWGTQGPPELRSIVATSKLIVDAELDNLVPHRVETLRIFSLEMARPEGPLVVRDSNRSTSTFEYE